MVSATSSPTSDDSALRFLGREFRFGNLNAICMKGPVPYALGLTELDLRCVPRTRFICSFDFKRALANFRFISIFSKNILHKPSDVPCHDNLLITYSVRLMIQSFHASMLRRRWRLRRTI